MSTSIELQPVKAYDQEIGPSVPTTPGGANEGRGSPDRSDSPVFEENMSAALPPVDGGRQAWTFLFAATVMETTVWGLPYTVGVLHEYWSSKMFPHDESTLTLAATLQTGLMFISTTVLGPLFTTFPRQRQYFQVVGLIVSTASLIGAAYVTKASHLVATIGCLYPFAGALYLPCATLLYEWFQRRRGLAAGIMFAGTGIGGTLFPVILNGLLKRFGYKAAMISLGIGYGLLNLVALFFIKRRVPLPQRTHGTQRHAREALNWRVGLTWAFWCGMSVLFLTSLGNFNPTLWIPTFAENVHATSPNGAGLVAIMNAASVPGNALAGWISDRVTPRITVVGSCICASVATLTLWGLGTSSPVLIGFSVVWGFTALSFVSLWSRMITRICKNDTNLTVIVFSLFAMLRGVGNLTSGPVSTLLLKTDAFRGAAGAYGSTNFGAVLIYTAATSFAGGVVGAFFPI